MTWELPIGAQPKPEGTRFRVWAPDAQQVMVLIEAEHAQESFTLHAEADGYFATTIAGLGAGTRYRYQLNRQASFPDPASRAQPDGVHGPSMVVDPTAFEWSDQQWAGISIQQAVIYELHVGTATRAGTFEALIEHLEQWRELGITALQLLPVTNWPGARNWGYDSVNLYAPATAYGGAHGLRKLVDAAHAHGLAVILDLVYNHFGPEGNYLHPFAASYFTKRHITPWGDAFNFDGPDSRPVRDFFINNALYWFHEYHVDGLRLDATHHLLDDSVPHLLAEIHDRVRAEVPPGRQFLLICEDERNQRALITPREQGGYGFDAVWADDLHHQLRVAFTGEHEGYYANYSGSSADIAQTLQQGWFFTGQPYGLKQLARGTSSSGLPRSAFIHCIQNHDQVGNRAFGDRLSHVLSPQAYRAVSTLLLLTPGTPMLWMGQEWAASTPFLFFSDFEPQLGQLVTKGRRREFAGFSAFAGADIPDPQALETFLRSKLNWEERQTPPHASMLRLYSEALQLRRTLLAEPTPARIAAAAAGPDSLYVSWIWPDRRSVLVVNLRGNQQLTLPAALLDSSSSVRFSSDDPRYGGSGASRLLGQTLHCVGPVALLLE